jgi:hypothetical protein
MPVTQSDLDWVAARLLPDIYDINQRDKYDRVTRHLTSLLHELENPMSAIDRIKAKALEAKGIATNAIKAFETDLDSLLAEKATLDTKRAEAVAPHKELISGIYSEIDGLKQAMDLLSNGGPPLDSSETAAPGSVPQDHYHDPSYIKKP